LSTHRRFWQAVSVLRREDGAYEVRLDGRPIRLPGGGTVAVPARSLADAIAAEWSAIEPRAPFVPTDLPLTRIAGTMIERIAPNPDSVKETLLEYGLSDLLACRDPALADRQAACFDPILARFADHWGVSPRPMRSRRSGPA
jgi:chaperone required for assembly of F1-ATPase